MSFHKFKVNNYTLTSLIIFRPYKQQKGNVTFYYPPISFDNVQNKSLYVH